MAGKYKKYNPRGFGLEQVRAAVASTSDECVAFIGYHNTTGYPLLQFDGRAQSVKRVVLTLKLGRPIAEGLEAVRTCATIGCISGMHIVEGTHSKALKNGHERGTANRCSAHRSFTPEQIRTMREMIAGGAFLRNVAALYGISATAVGKIRDHKLYKDVL